MTVSPSVSLSSCWPKAMRPSAARCSPCPPVAMIRTSSRGRRIAVVEVDRLGEIVRDSRWPWRPGGCGRASGRRRRPGGRSPWRRGRSSAAGGVGGEGGDEHAPVGACDFARAALVDAGFGAGGRSPGRRWSNRRPERARPRRRSLLQRLVARGRRAPGVSSIFQSPVWKMRPCGVSISRPLPSGIEWASAT